ncbi:MAG: hypothetical protein PHW40_07545 [Candidatus Izemoplasmatales bacterium]|nr:hypothetical protein [Candidatus Izemoplasmatales bacterium]
MKMKEALKIVKADGKTFGLDVVMIQMFCDGSFAFEALTKTGKIVKGDYNPVDGVQIEKDDTDNGHLVDDDGNPVLTFQRFTETAPAFFTLPALAVLWHEHGVGCLEFAQHPDYDITMTWLENQVREISLTEIIESAYILNETTDDYITSMYGVTFDDLTDFRNADGLTSYLVWLSHE